MRVVLDLEADGLNPSQIWCVVCKNLETGDVTVFTRDDRFNLRLYLSNVRVLIAHNGIDYDYPVLSRLWNIDLSGIELLDTLVLSRLYHQKMDGGHSLEAWGERLKFPKGNHTDFSKLSQEMIDYCIQDVELTHKVYETLKSRMKSQFDKAIWCEHEMAVICREMKENGFKFDYTTARTIQSELTNRLSEIDKAIFQAFPRKSVEVKTFKPRLTKHGIINRADFRWYAGTDYTIFDPEAELTVFEWEEFNPQSPKQVIERLEPYWNPVDRTDGYIDAKRSRDKEKLEKLDRYGWKLNENNLATLNDNAPEGAKSLVERTLIASRLRTLQTWFDSARHLLWVTDQHIEKSGITGQKFSKDNESLTGTTIIRTKTRTMIVDYDEITKLLLTISEDLKPCRTDVVLSASNIRNWFSIMTTETETFVDFSAYHAMLNLDGMNLTEKLSNYTCRIKGTFNSLGTWVHRLSHSNPNMGNIAAEKTIKYNTKHLRDIAIEYGGRMRKLWVAEKGSYLVGCDMEGAHLRLFAHFIDDKDFINALINGDKKLGTDPHTLNKNIIGELCPDRDRAKTFIFTFLNGGAAPKVAQIFNCDRRAAEDILERFVRAYPGLAHLRNKVFPAEAARGYFFGLDGRIIFNTDERLMMAGYLQNGEATVMKHANIRWKHELKKLGIPFKQVNFVHDEFQTEVYGDEAMAREVARIQAKAITDVGLEFGLRCPLAGETKIGKNWLETH